MDNNLNNGSGIPNVSDIKFDDTPAESFDNLYGGSNNVQNVQPTPSVAPNPGVVSGVQPTPSVAPNPGVVPGVQPTQSVAPNPGVVPGVQPTQSVAPNPGVVPGVQPTQSVAPNPGVVPGVQPTPSVAPNPGVVPGVQPTQSVAPNPGVVPGVQPTPSVASNPGTIIQPQGTDLSNVNIDANKMQSIEEQLSKTSQYNPEDIQKEMLSISSDNQSDKNKSGLAFVIVLFIILALVIAFLPQITKLIK